MNTLKKATALVAATSTLLSMSASLGVVSAASNAELRRSELKIDTLKYDFGREAAFENIKSHDFDLNADDKLDFLDYDEMRNAINKLYADNDFNDIRFAVNAVTPTKAGTSFDADGDNALTYYDYCYFLDYVQGLYGLNDDYENEDRAYAVRDEKGNIKKEKGFCVKEGESNAVLLHFVSNEKEVVLPTEVYTNGHIIPVMHIAGNAMKKCTNMETLTIRNYVQPEWYNKIERYDSEFTVIKNAGKVSNSTYINVTDGAFNGCDKLTTLNFPVNINILPAAVENTNFGKNKDNLYEKDGIRYIKSSDEKAIIAAETVSLINNFTVEDGKRCVNIADKTTTISNNIKNGKGGLNSIEFDYSLNIPDSVKYIHSAESTYGFKGSTHLRWVNGYTYDQLEGDIKELVTNFNSAFVNTPFINEPADRIANEIVADIEKNCHTDREKAEAVCKYIFTKDDYTNFDDAFGGALFPNGDYNTSDFARDNIYVIANAFLTDHTECASFAMSVSLLLDKLGIENFVTGTSGHAYNHAYIDGKWYRIDMSGYSDYNLNYDLYLSENGEESFLKEDIGTNCSVASNDQSIMFADSKQIKSDSYLMTVLDDSHSKMTVFVRKGTDIPEKFNNPAYNVVEVDITRKSDPAEGESVNTYKIVSVDGCNFVLVLTSKCEDGEIAESLDFVRGTHGLTYYDSYGRRVYGDCHVDSYGAANHGTDRYLRYVGENGFIGKATISYNGNMFTTDKEGYIKGNGFIEIKGKKYYLRSDRVCIGWQPIDNDYYFFDNNCVMVTDQIIKSNGSFFYLDQSGKLAKDTQITWNGRTFNADFQGKLDLSNTDFSFIGQIAKF